MRVNLKNPRVEYLNRNSSGEHLIKFDLDMYLVEDTAEQKCINRSVILQVDEKEIWSIAPGCQVPRKIVNIKEPDNIEVVKFIND